MATSKKSKIVANEFAPGMYPRGSRYDIDLDIGLDEMLPLILLRGKQKGQTLVVMAGIHGDEYEGVRAILELSRDLDPAMMKGDLLAVTAANPSALWAGTRTNPADGGNLARLFPGSPNGKPSEVVAFHLGQSVIAHADFFLDLHSAGIKLLMPSMVGYDATDERSRDAAMDFGVPVVWGHPEVERGRTISFAAEHGIPWLYTEARGAGRISPDDLQMFKRGMRNLLVRLGIVHGRIEATPPQHHLYGNGDTDSSLAASKQGFFVPDVDLLDPVSAGEELGRTLSLHGETLETFLAPRSGVIGLVRAFPVVQPGDPVFLIAETHS
jgi:predicted deacylase